MARLRERVRRWSDDLFRPVDAASLAVFRIVFGLAVAVDAWRYLAYGWVTEYYIRPQIHFTYLYLDFVRPWPGDWMLAHYWLMSGLALLAAAGLFYRVTSVLLFLAYAYVFLLEQAVYMNHHYLMVLLSLLLACMPAANAYSLDRLLFQAPKPPSPQALPTVPRWCVDIVRFQVVIVYLFGALAKLNQDWLSGEPMYSSLTRDPSQVPEFARWLPAEVLAYSIAYGGVLADLAIPLLLLYRRTFWLGFAFAAVFHAFNAALLRIGVFSYLMTGAILIFLPPDWSRRPGRWWRRDLSIDTAAERTPPPRDERTKIFTRVLLGVYVAVQLLLPLRHFLYPGVVSWTEEGHRFAWHMKLRQKHSVMRVTATDPATGRSWEIRPSADLTLRQRRKVETFPDMLLQYVHAVRDRLRREGIDPVIKVEWMCALNGRPFQPLVDPEIDLAAEERTWRPATWIVPLRKRAS